MSTQEHQPGFLGPTFAAAEAQTEEARQLLPHQKYLSIRETPSGPQLATLLKEYRALPYDSATALSRAGVCIELATQTSTPFVAEKLLEEAEEQVTAIDTNEPSYREPRMIQARMLQLFIPNYRAQLVQKRRPTIADEQRVWTDALGVMEGDRFKTMVENQHNSNYQALLAMLAMNARYNVRCDTIVQHAWPSLPRHASPYLQDQPKRPDWNLGIGKPEAPLDWQKFIVRHKGKITQAESSRPVRTQYADGIGVVAMSSLTHLPVGTTAAALLKTEAALSEDTKQGEGSKLAGYTIDYPEAYTLVSAALDYMTMEVLNQMGWEV